MLSHCGQTILKNVYFTKEYLFVLERFFLDFLNTYGEHEDILLLQIFQNTFPTVNFIYFATFLIPKVKTVSILLTFIPL